MADDPPSPGGAAHVFDLVNTRQVYSRSVCRGRNGFDRLSHPVPRSFASRGPALTPGYRYDVERQGWLADSVFPKWKERFPEPPDLVGVTRIYEKEVDMVVMRAVQVGAGGRRRSCGIPSLGSYCVDCWSGGQVTARTRRVDGACRTTPLRSLGTKGGLCGQHRDFDLRIGGKRGLL